MKDTTVSKSKLGARWQLSASMLSRPADLSALVTLSQSKPEEFFEDDTLHILVSKLLNCQNEQVSDKDTKLDVLAILANLSGSGDARAKEEVRTALQGVSEWFDDYLAGEQGDGLEQEPELHKSMLLLLARAWNYELKTEDLLELTRGDRGLALDSVVGVLEDGRTYSTELVQSRKPGEGNVAQWEHELICRQHEKPLVLQLCRLVRGFTHPASYFAGDGNPSSCMSHRNSDDGREGGGRGKNGGNREDLALFSVDEFSAEMDSLLEITLRSRVIEKLSVALDMCLFQTQRERERSPETNEGVLDWEGNRGDNGTTTEGSGGTSGRHEECRAPLEDSDHLAVHCVHIFMQNLYQYATQNTDFYRQHMLSDTLLVPRLVLPYLDQCVRQAKLLCHRRGPSANFPPSNGWVDEGRSRVGGEHFADRNGKSASEVEVALAQGIASSLRTLVIASFRAPPNKFVLGLMQRMNPTGSLLRARPFVARHDYVFTLLCLLNVNLGALNTSDRQARNGGPTKVGAGREVGGACEAGETPLDLSLETVLAQGLLDDMAGVFNEMTPEAKRRVVERVTRSRALPVSRDAPGYAAVLSLFGIFDSDENADEGGANGEASRAENKSCPDGEDWASGRKLAKTEAEERVRKLSQASRTNAAGDVHESNTGKVEDSKVETSPTARAASAQRSSRNRRSTASAVAEAKGTQGSVSGDRRRGTDKQSAGGMTSLGDLPALGKKMDPAALADLKRQRVRVDLDLPINAMTLRLRAVCEGGHLDGSRTSRSSKESKRDGGNGSGDARCEGSGGDQPKNGGPSQWGRIERGNRNCGDANGADGVPREFLCAINGHTMKQPTRSPHGHVFEYSTILLWLESRGRVCPFTGKPLSKEDLVPDEELRTRVMRWHIQKTGVNIERGGLEGDEIYDF